MEKQGLFQKLKAGLGKTRESWLSNVFSGRERIDVLVSRQGLRETEANEEGDIWFYEAEEWIRGHRISLEAGMLAVFYPQDIHRPCICADQPQTVEKVVFKIRV